MAKLSATGRLVLFLVDSPYARVSISLGNGISPVGIATMERGHGTKSNPRADTILKLMDVGVLEGEEHMPLRLTKRGRTVLAEEQAKGWELVTAVGEKPTLRKAE